MRAGSPISFATFLGLSLASHGDVTTALSHEGEASYIRDYFYVGGQYISDGAGGHIFSDQMYVEKLQPVEDVYQPYPIVLMHGQGQTGTNFLNKPDGGTGWASRFLEQGYEVYIIDQTFRGRSPWAPGAGAALPSTFSVETIQQRFTAAKDYMLWPQAVNHTQWPGNGTVGDSVFEAFYSSQVQFINNATYQQSTVQAATAKLLDRIGKPVILIGHSQGGILPILAADVRPDLAKALILLEPTGPPFKDVIIGNGSARAYGVTDIPITYEPPVTNPAVDLIKQEHPPASPEVSNCTLQADSPPPRQLVNLSPKPILFLTTESSFHAFYDYCNVAYLKQAGCSKLEFLELGNVGIHGNGHMVFMEKNSDQVQGLLHEWIGKLDS